MSKLELDISSEIIPSLQAGTDQDNKHGTYPVISDISQGLLSWDLPLSFKNIYSPLFYRD